MLKPNKKLNEKGFVSHLLIALLFIIIIGLCVAAFLYVKQQNKNDSAKQQQIDTTNAEISKLKSEQKIPQDWKTYSLGNGDSVILPNNYQQTQAVYGSYIFKDPSKEYDNVYRVNIAAHVASKPSINNRTFSYDTYCQLNGTVWQSFINNDGVQTENTDHADVDACSKITAQSSNGIHYYAFEDMTNESDHIALAVQAGNKYFVLNFEKYFNGYGQEAIKAVSDEQNKTMKVLVEKIARANQ